MMGKLLLLKSFEGSVSRIFVGLVLFVVVFVALIDHAAATDAYFPETKLTDQSGKDLRFYSDIVQGKVVVVHSFFGSCKDSCPVILGKMKKLQERLGNRLGQNVRLLSVTVDPVQDRPEELARLAESLGARSGWYFLTGKKANIDWVLYKLGHYVEAREAHKSQFIIGNEPSGIWAKLLVNADVKDLYATVERVSAGK